MREGKEGNREEEGEWMRGRGMGRKWGRRDMRVMGKRRSGGDGEELSDEGRRGLRGRKEEGGRCVM